MVMVSDGEDDTWVRIWSQVVVQRQREEGVAVFKDFVNIRRLSRAEWEKKNNTYIFAEQLVDTKVSFLQARQ